MKSRNKQLLQSFNMIQNLSMPPSPYHHPPLATVSKGPYYSDGYPAGAGGYPAGGGGYPAGAGGYPADHGGYPEHGGYPRDYPVEYPVAIRNSPKMYKAKKGKGRRHKSSGWSIGKPSVKAQMTEGTFQ